MTQETDRSGRPAHRACTERVLATVAREACPPYDDFRGVAGWLAEQTAAAGALPEAVEGFRVGGRHEMAQRLAAQAGGGAR